MGIYHKIEPHYNLSKIIDGYSVLRVDSNDAYSRLTVALCLNEENALHVRKALDLLESTRGGYDGRVTQS